MVLRASDGQRLLLSIGAARPDTPQVLSLFAAGVSHGR